MILEEAINNTWQDKDAPIIIKQTQKIYYREFTSIPLENLSQIKQGDVVALIGDFDAISIKTLIKLIDANAIVVPCTKDTRSDHPYFFETAGVNYVIEDGNISKINDGHLNHDIYIGLREQNKPGLVLFSTGTTGRPKAIVHDVTKFLKKFTTPRPTLKTLSFLLFDHIGGINTLLHSLFNGGTLITTTDRSVDGVLAACKEHAIELVPTTPTFLRMLLISGKIPQELPETLKIITYGTERMDSGTLTQLCELLPNVDFRQTFGMSELGIVRVKSEARDSLFMKIGGEGIEYKVENEKLYIRSQNRMLGYLNAPSPFDSEGWYDTKDLVEVKGELIKVVGRDSEVINVGGLKFLTSEVERAILDHNLVSNCKVYPKPNPITGQHVEAIVQLKSDASLNSSQMTEYLATKLQKHMLPQRIKFQNINISHRFKKL